MARALLITNIPNPYRIPLFNALHQQLEQQGITLRVLFGSEGYRRRRWEIDFGQCQFEYRILSSSKIELNGNAEKTVFSYSGLFRQIDDFVPDVVVTAGFSPATTKLWMRSWLRPIPYVIWTGSLERPSSWVRSKQRRLLAARASGFVAYGSKSKAYLIGLGTAPERISVAINTVDTSYFASETEKYRKTINASGLKHLLTIAYLQPGKNIHALLGAVDRIRERRNDFVLDIIGDGSYRARLEEFVADRALHDVVTFHGYKQRSELPRYLAQSACFVFPSNYDLWGLVVVEAMAAGLPVIASIKAGVVVDLVHDGITGFAVNFANTQAVDERIEWILDHPREARSMGAAARDFIAEHATVEKSATGLVDAILDVLSRQPNSVGLVS